MTGFVYDETTATPQDIDKMLAENSHWIEVYDVYLAWFSAARNWRKTELALAEARATMSWSGAVGKAKMHAVAATAQERIDYDIAAALYTYVERRAHTLSKQAMNLASRNKNILSNYAVGGGGGRY